MAVQAEALRSKIAAELDRVADPRVISFVRSLLVEPEPVERPWDYGEPDQRYTCWTVLKNGAVGVAYCEQGFGPDRPWGLVWLEGDGAKQSMGMDSEWYATFLEAVRDESLAKLPVWRVYRKVAGVRHPLTPEGEWRATWDEVEKLRLADPAGWYDCDTDALPERV